MMRKSASKQAALAAAAAAPLPAPSISKGIDAATLATLDERVTSLFTDSEVHARFLHKYGGRVRCYERFLCARNGEITKALAMITDTIKFRLEWRMDDADTFPVDEEQLAMCAAVEKHWIGNYAGETLDGSAVQLMRFKHLKPKALVKQFSEEQFTLFYLSWMEKSLAHQNASESNTAPRKMGSDNKVTIAASGDDASSGVTAKLASFDIGGAITTTDTSKTSAIDTNDTPAVTDAIPAATQATPPVTPAEVTSAPVAAAAAEISGKRASSNTSNESKGVDGFPGTGWHGMVEIYDLGGLGMSQIHVKGLRMVSRVLGLGQAHYPENLRTAFFINTPGLFKAVWSTLKLVLDKNTVEKIVMTRHNNEVVLKNNLAAKTFDTVQNWHPPAPTT